MFAQVNTGRILGTITDQTGGVIAGAMVTVTNAGTGVTRTLTTDQAGEYLAPNLTPGTYSVRATSMGFQTFERQRRYKLLSRRATSTISLSSPGIPTATP